jgi:hypothetical protein
MYDMPNGRGQRCDEEKDISAGDMDGGIPCFLVNNISFFLEILYI